MGFLSNYKFVMGHQTSQIQFVHRKFNVKYARALGNRFSCGSTQILCVLYLLSYIHHFCAFVVVSDSLGSPLKPRFLFNLSSPTGGV